MKREGCESCGGFGRNDAQEVRRAGNGSASAFATAPADSSGLPPSSALRSCIVLTLILSLPHFSHVSSTCVRSAGGQLPIRCQSYRCSSIGRAGTYVNLLLLNIPLLHQTRLLLPQAGRECGRVGASGDDLVLRSCRTGEQEHTGQL